MAASVFREILPPNSRTATLDSYAKHIIRERNHEFNSDAQQSYGPSGNNVIRFKIASNDSFLDLQNSHFKMDLATALLYNGDSDLSRALAEGGINACFRRITIRAANGALIAEVNNYNQLQAILSNATESREHVETGKIPAGDSVNPWSQYPVQAKPGYQLLGRSNASWAYDVTGGAAAKLITITNGDTSQLYEGQKLLVTYTNNAGDVVVSYVTVTSIVSDTTFTIDETLDGVNDVTFDMVELLSSDIEDTIIPAARWAAARGGPESSPTDTAAVRLCFNPSLPFFWQYQLFPLFLINGGIYIEFEIEPTVAKVLVSGVLWTTSGAFDGASLTITNPKYVGHMIQASEEVRTVYYTMFKDKGFFMHFTNFLCTNLSDASGAAGETTQQIFPGKRSCKFVLAAIQDARHEGTVSDVAANSYVVDCLADTLSSQIDRYYYSAQSLRFPLDSYVDLANDAYLSEALQYYERALGINGMRDMCHRFPASHWWAVNADGATTNESLRFIAAAPLSKGYDPLVGLDLKDAPLQVYFHFAAAHAPRGSTEDRKIRLFLAYDTIIHFQVAQTMVVFG